MVLAKSSILTHYPIQIIQVIQLQILLLRFDFLGFLGFSDAYYLQDPILILTVQVRFGYFLIEGFFHLAMHC